jgi:hypothetical protein
MSTILDDALLRISDPNILPDGWFRFTMERRDGETFTASCTATEAPDVIAYFAMTAKAANEAQGFGAETPPQAAQRTPIHVTGIGFAPGEPPSETHLILNMSGIALSFAISNSGLARLADDVARVARTLSAPTDRKSS